MKVQELINVLQKFDVNHTIRLKVKGEYKNVDLVSTGRFINTVEFVVFDDISIEQAEGETMTTLLAGNEIPEARMGLIIKAIGQERFDEIKNEIEKFRKEQQETAVEESDLDEIANALSIVDDTEFDEEADRAAVEKARAEFLVEKLYKGEDLSEAEMERLPAAKKLLGKKAVAAIKKAAESAE